ncbi:MAG: hypothetical protein R3F17_14960 [Planctomycetota bacterium]
MRPLELATELAVPERTLVEVFQALVDAHVLVFAEDEFLEDAAVVPARDLENIHLQDVYDALVGKRGPVESPRAAGPDAAVDEIRRTFERQRSDVAGNISMRELARRFEQQLRAGQEVPETLVAESSTDPEGSAAGA